MHAVLRRALVEVAIWNVNSIRARLDLACDWLERAQPEVLCMQEAKVDDDFPTDEFMRLGYAVAMAGQLSRWRRKPAAACQQHVGARARSAPRPPPTSAPCRE